MNTVLEASTALHLQLNGNKIDHICLFFLRGVVDRQFGTVSCHILYISGLKLVFTQLQV